MSIPVDGELMVYGIDDPDAFFESVFCCEGYGYKELEIAGETYYHYYFQFRYQPEGLKDLSKEFDCVIEAYSNIDYDGYILHELYDHGKKIKYEKIKPKNLKNFKPDDGSDFYHADFSDCFEITKQENKSSKQNTSDTKKKASPKPETSKKSVEECDNTIVIKSYSDYVSIVDSSYKQCCGKINALYKSVVGEKPITRSNDSRIKLITTGAEEQMQNYAATIKQYIAALEARASKKDDYDSSLENDISMIIYSYDALTKAFTIEFTEKKTEIIKCPGASTVSKKVKVWRKKYDSLPSRAMQDLKDELKEQEKALKKKKSELEKKRVDDENKNEIQEKIKVLKDNSTRIRRDINDTKETVSRYETECNDLNEELVPIHRYLSGEESKLEDKKNAYTRDYAKLNGHLMDLEDEREKAQKNRQSLIEEEKVARTNANNSFFLKKKHLKEADRIATLITEADKYLQDLDATEERIKRNIEETMNRYNEFYYSVSNRITDLRAQRDELDRKISAKKISIDTERSKLKNLEAEYDVNKKELDELSKKMTQINTYEKGKKEVEEAEKQVEDTKNEINKIKDKIKQADNSKEKDEKFVIEKKESIEEALGESNEKDEGIDHIRHKSAEVKKNKEQPAKKSSNSKSSNNKSNKKPSAQHTRGKIFRNIEAIYQFSSAEEIAELVKENAEIVAGESEQNFLALVLLATNLGLASKSGTLNDKEEWLVDQLWKGSDVYKTVAIPVSESSFNSLAALCNIPGAHRLVMALLNIILGFAYIDGEVDDKVLDRLESIYGMHLLVEFANSGLESVPDPPKRQVLSDLENDIIEAIRDAGGTMPKDDILERFDYEDEDDVQEALDHLLEEGILMGGDNFINSMYFLNED